MRPGEVHARILRAAQRTVEDRGYAQMTVSELVRAAGVSRAAFYRHFGSKRALRSRLAAAHGHFQALPAEPETRKRILAAALRCFAQRGFHGSSLSAIAREAGVSRAGVIWHFRRKQALLAAIVEDQGMPTRERGEVDSRAPDQPSLQRLARVLYDTLMARREVLYVLLEVLREPEARSALERIFHEGPALALDAFLRLQMERGLYRALPPRLAGQAFIAPILFAVLLGGIQEERPIDLQKDDSLAALVQVYLEGIQRPSTG